MLTLLVSCVAKVATGYSELFVVNQSIYYLAICVELVIVLCLTTRRWCTLGGWLAVLLGACGIVVVYSLGASCGCAGGWFALSVSQHAFLDAAIGISGLIVAGAFAEQRMAERV